METAVRESRPSHPSLASYKCVLSPPQTHRPRTFVGLEHGPLRALLYRGLEVGEAPPHVDGRPSRSGRWSKCVTGPLRRLMGPGPPPNEDASTRDRLEEEPADVTLSPQAGVPVLAALRHRWPGGPGPREVDDGQCGRRHRHPGPVRFATRSSTPGLWPTRTTVASSPGNSRRRRGARMQDRRTRDRLRGSAEGPRARRPRVARSRGCVRLARRQPGRCRQRFPRAIGQPQEPGAAPVALAVAGGRVFRPTSPTCRAAAGSRCSCTCFLVSPSSAGQATAA